MTAGCSINLLYGCRLRATVTPFLWTTRSASTSFEHSIPLSSDERQVRWDAALVGAKLLAEPGREQPILDADSNFHTDAKEHQRQQQEPDRRDEQPGSEQHAEHGGVDRMANQPVRSGLHQLVICVQSRVESPLPSQRAGAGP